MNFRVYSGSMTWNITINGIYTGTKYSGYIDENPTYKFTYTVPAEKAIIQGQIVYELHDSYGDGWDSCAIKIIDTSGDDVVETLTMANGRELSGTTESLLPGHVYNLFWNNGSYPGETSFSLKNESGDLLYEGGGIGGNCVFLIVQVDYTVTITTDGNGTAIADVTSGPQGTEVTLTATPNSGYRFKEWEVISGDVTIENNKFTIGTSDVEVKAIFEVIQARGDLDNDKSITIKDVRLLLQAYINSSSSTEWTSSQLAIMDMNEDRTVNIMDVRLLLQTYINL